jgi:hypothetical protein
MGWRAMQTTDGTRMDVPSELADLRGIPLQEMPALAPMTLDKAVQRVLPGSLRVAARGAAFSSAI